ncbi:hypothetical protein HJC23_002457 [Cyclotella cryptica]|uniref:Carboxyvinyl-carboxyphosphonate phosphorylmutase n=1 Tax=Cyclotella cryptica TaxID=29204 RepID=A0ABD3PX62_9STRA
MKAVLPIPCGGADEGGVGFQQGSYSGEVARGTGMEIFCVFGRLFFGGADRSHCEEEGGYDETHWGEVVFVCPAVLLTDDVARSQSIIFGMISSYLIPSPTDLRPRAAARRGTKSRLFVERKRNKTIEDAQEFEPSLHINMEIFHTRPSALYAFTSSCHHCTPPPATPANVLYSLISANRKHAYENKELLSAIPLAGIHDALSAKIFAQKGAPALFLSGFGVSASLLGVPDAGVTSLVEMEQVTRNVCSAMRSHKGLKVPPPLIVDGDTGYGGSPNMLRTISSLASAGAAAITIEDQVFPKMCTIAAGEKIRIVEREEAVGRVRGALGARDLYCERVSLSTTESTSSGAGCWIVARTDCRLAFGFEEVVERCLRFEELGAEIVYAENLQSIDEYLKLRE